MFLALMLQAAPPIIDWQPFDMQRSPDGGLFDRTSAKRNGDVVNAWVRLVNMEMKGVNERRQQADAHMEVDCRRSMMRAIAFRVVGPDGTVLKAVPATPTQGRWQPARVGMRGYDIRVGLCERVR